MAAAPTPLARTSTDTLVTALGRLHDSLGKLVLESATGAIFPAEARVALQYARAHARIAEDLDARLARS
jgi:hypothetical protein